MRRTTLQGEDSGLALVPWLTSYVGGAAMRAETQLLLCQCFSGCASQVTCVKINHHVLKCIGLLLELQNENGRAWGTRTAFLTGPSGDSQRHWSLRLLGLSEPPSSMWWFPVYSCTSESGCLGPKAKGLQKNP